MPSFEPRPEKKPSKAAKWLKTSAALAGAAAVGYFGALKKEKGGEVIPSLHSPSEPRVEVATSPASRLDAKTHVEMRRVKIADGVEGEHAMEVDEKGNVLRDLGSHAGWEEAQKKSFQGYGVSTDTKGGEVVKTPYGSKEGNKTNFSGYGISTETENGKVTKTPYGESKDGKRTFKGYGIER